MAKQIIVTQGDTGIELSVQFVDDKKKPIDITGKEIEVNFVNPNEEVYETMYAQIVDGTQGIASIILTDKHTSITDLHKTYWACMDDNGYVTAQTDLFYYVKEKLGGASITESNGELDADGFIEEINKIIEGQEYQQSLIETNAHNIQNNANSITSLRSETSKIKDLAEENKAKINSFVEQDANAKVLNEIINARQGENALVDNINKIKDSITNHNHDTQYAKPSDITTLTNNLNEEKANITKNTNDIANANNSIKELQEFKTNGGTIGGNININDKLLIGSTYEGETDIISQEPTLLLATNEKATDSADKFGLVLDGSKKAFSSTYALRSKATIGTSTTPWKDGYFDNIHVGTSSAQSNGYTTLPNGLVFQWGTISSVQPNTKTRIGLPIMVTTLFPPVVSIKGGWDSSSPIIDYYDGTGIDVVHQSPSAVQINFLAIGYI